MNFERTNKKLSLLEDFYTHFDEDGRLKTRHGYVEYYTNMAYIHKYLKDKKEARILDVGAGTGAYAIPLKEEGYDVTAVELVKEHCEKIKEKTASIPIYNRDARDLSFLEDYYDLILIFGPLYHVHTDEDKLMIINQAKAHLKPTGCLMMSYYMNDYAIMMYGFLKGHIGSSLLSGAVDKNYHVQTHETDLFSFVTLEDINRYDKLCGLERLEIIASDGLTDYFRTPINQLSEEDYHHYLDYHLKTASRPDLLGYSSHLLDIVSLKEENHEII